MIEKIISGGQTGTDRGALDAALALGIPCGGSCPRGRRAEDGRIPDRYPLSELTSAHYRDRTEQNVRDADATLVLTRGEVEGGTALTIALARKLGRPVLVLNVSANPALGPALIWLQTHRIRVLNVAGPRESRCPGIQREVRQWLEQLLVTAAE